MRDWRRTAAGLEVEVEVEVGCEFECESELIDGLRASGEEGAVVPIVYARLGERRAEEVGERRAAAGVRFVNGM